MANMRTIFKLETDGNSTAVIIQDTNEKEFVNSFGTAMEALRKNNNPVYDAIIAIAINCILEDLETDAEIQGLFNSFLC